MKKLLTAFLALLIFSGCSSVNVKSEIFSSSNRDQVLQDIGKSNMDSTDKGKIVSAIARSAFGDYSVNGKSVSQIIDEQTKFQAEEAARDAAQKEAQLAVEAKRLAVISELKDSIEVFPLGKTFIKADYESGSYSDSIGVKFKIINHSKKDIREFKGIVHWANQFGDVIESTSIDYTHVLPANYVAINNMTVDYNQFSENDKRLAQTALSNLKFTWEPTAVSFTDGSSVVAPEGQ